MRQANNISGHQNNGSNGTIICTADTTVLLDRRIRHDQVTCRWLGSEIGSPQKKNNGCYVFAQPYIREVTTVASCSV
jgi:hypothetical protein